MVTYRHQTADLACPLSSGPRPISIAADKAERTINYIGLRYFYLAYEYRNTDLYLEALRKDDACSRKHGPASMEQLIGTILFHLCRVLA